MRPSKRLLKEAEEVVKLARVERLWGNMMANITMCIGGVNISVQTEMKRGTFYIYVTGVTTRSTQVEMSDLIENLKLLQTKEGQIKRLIELTETLPELEELEEKPTKRRSRAIKKPTAD